MSDPVNDPGLGDPSKGGDRREPASVIDRITARTGDPEDEAAIQRLFEATFGVSRSSAEWRWRFLDAPTPSLIRLFELDGELVGHIAYTGFEHFLDGDRREMVTGGDWMYRPDVRGKGVNDRLLRPFARQYTEVIAGLSFPSPAARAVAARNPLPTAAAFEIPQWVRWRTGRAVRRSNARVPRPIGRLLALGSSVVALAGAMRPTARRVVEPCWGDGHDLDALAERLRDAARCIRVRDHTYLTWRWRQQPDRSWWMLTCRRSDGQMTGWAVAGLDPTTPGTGRIVDLLAEDAASATALVAAAHRRLVRQGAELTSCELLDPRPWARSAMARAGFAHRPGGPIGRVGRPLPGNEDWTLPGSWYVTRGDTDFA